MPSSETLYTYLGLTEAELVIDISTIMFVAFVSKSWHVDSAIHLSRGCQGRGSNIYQFINPLFWGVCNRTQAKSKGTWVRWMRKPLAPVPSHNKFLQSWLHLWHQLGNTVKLIKAYLTDIPTTVVVHATITSKNYYTQQLKRFILTLKRIGRTHRHVRPAAT